MITKAINEIGIEDFQSLIDNGISERKTIEYKSILIVDKISDKKEFLFDVSSFANANGGDLIFGIAANDAGQAEKMDGIEIDNSDKCILQIESLIRDGIKPRILGIHTEIFKLPTSKSILLIRIPKSWNTPHQTIYQDANKFYSRGTTGKYQMDYLELKNAFLQSETIIDRVRQFRNDRILSIWKNQAPMLLGEGAKIALHLIPMNSFYTTQKYDLNYIKNDQRRLPLILEGGRELRYNLDGILRYSKYDSDSHSVAYTQFSRNGIIEAVDSGIFTTQNNEGFLACNHDVRMDNYERELVRTIQKFVGLLAELKVDLPVFIFLSFIYAKNLHIEYGSRYVNGKDHKFSNDIVLIPEIILDNYNTDIPTLLKPMFDMVWNACNFEKSISYNDSGIWKYYPPK